MSIAPVEINLELINQKVKFIVLSKTNQETPITIDFSPPLGDGEGFLDLCWMCKYRNCGFIKKNGKKYFCIQDECDRH